MLVAKSSRDGSLSCTAGAVIGAGTAAAGVAGTGVAGTEASRRQAVCVAVYGRGISVEDAIGTRTGGGFFAPRAWPLAHVGTGARAAGFLFGVPRVDRIETAGGVVWASASFCPMAGGVMVGVYGILI